VIDTAGVLETSVTQLLGAPGVPRTTVRTDGGTSQVKSRLAVRTDGGDEDSRGADSGSRVASGVTSATPPVRRVGEDGGRVGEDARRARGQPPWFDVSARIA
jgi:hypothetical protein